MNGQSISLAIVSILGVQMMTLPADAVSNSRLTVEVSGLRNQNGTLCLSLFSSEQGFPNQSDRAIASRCIDAKEATATFDQLPPGRYAVAVIHDSNDDGKLNTGFLGIPREGFGFSRNPRIGTRAPSFRDTAFLVAGESTKIQIALRYLL
ncbi:MULTISPECIES: DUF2141 domain-containing protein [Leptolyngbya]|uniref:DUF2141 domain-containing protein n=1 Tax=Leptolyngbya TaxID=47251 RepID=UPI001688F07E|nr:DUF2141 domain-containing protein [Leptolyngbya sp. FACHB-1624]MBD1856418.1 DUF2141 domain-containing protein [Leptolyngbya sp. FACHB-1624]